MSRRKSSEPKCSLFWCHGEVYANGLCSAHYHNQNRNGGTIKLGEDAQALLGYATRTHVVFANIVNRCWQDQEGVRVCRYCGCAEHSPNCIVVSVSALMDGVPTGGRMARNSSQPGG